ncbi:uncharacterized protein LOC128961664 [Oppia nitens]|uniref:uncharacterized protein LOC128961664 n=1 Tax=Oppia nitens TaxID=1686743 RepID=UPI0023DA8495|nr:uncharacterized protein LOC128961664 [Oppia nitens]
MAKYLAQIVVLGAQVVARAFTRALRQEFAASQSAANQRRANNESNSGSVNTNFGMSLQEAMQILNVEDMKLTKPNEESILKNYNHLLEVNDKSKGGSFYIQSKKYLQNWTKLMATKPMSRLCGNTYHLLLPIVNINHVSQMKSNPTFIIQTNCLHTSVDNISDDVFEEAISEQNIMNCIKTLQDIKIVRPKKSFTIGRTREPSKAAVLVPFCRLKDNQPAVLLTQRSNTLTNHRGEVCFPGGIEDHIDNNEMIRTAVRETVEELGIEENCIKVFGALNSFPALSGALVHPVLGFIDISDYDFTSRINKDEVETVFTVPLKRLIDQRNWKSTHWKAGWITPVFTDTDKNNPRIWGLTAGILYTVLAALLPKIFIFDTKFLQLIPTK